MTNTTRIQLETNSTIILNNVSYSLGLNFNQSGNSTTNATSYSTEGFIVIICGIICTLGNFSCILLIICHRRFRKSTAVILCHHCFLDFAKSLYCFPYGYSLMASLPVPFCSWIGSSYVFLVTTSAYNMMALVVNHDYDITYHHNRPDDCSCVLFGVIIIWLMSFLLNLGISIIPSNTLYNTDIGVCLFLYGCNYSYILHVLWILLMTMAVALSLIFFIQIKRKLSHRVKFHNWKFIHESYSEEFESMIDISIHNGRRNQGLCQKTTISQLRTTQLLISIVVSFILFWYPLFILTVFDYHFKVSPYVYRVLTFLSWLHPITTPIICSLILRDMEYKGYTLRDISSNLMPLRQVSSRRLYYENLHAFDMVSKQNEEDVIAVDDISRANQMDKNCLNTTEGSDIGFGFENQTLIGKHVQKFTSTV